MLHTLCADPMRTFLFLFVCLSYSFSRATAAEWRLSRALLGRVRPERFPPFSLAPVFTRSSQVFIVSPTLQVGIVRLFFCLLLLLLLLPFFHTTHTCWPQKKTRQFSIDCWRKCKQHSVHTQCRTFAIVKQRQSGGRWPRVSLVFLVFPMFHWFSYGFIVFRCFS